MSAMKDYFNDLINACSPDHKFGQDAIEHALLTGAISACTGDLTADAETIMSRYDMIVEYYQRHLKHLDVLKESVWVLCGQGHRDVLPFLQAFMLVNHATRHDNAPAECLHEVILRATTLIRAGLASHGAKLDPVAYKAYNDLAETFSNALL